MITLSTGRTIEAWDDVVGINPQNPAIIFGGHDSFDEGSSVIRPMHRNPEDWESWTKEEKLELASIMIAAWQAYAEKVKAAS